MTLSILTPSRKFYTGAITSISLKSTNGQLVIKPMHTPFVFALNEGIISFDTAEGTQYAAVMSGFVEVTNNKVTLLTDAAEWPEEIDESRAKEARDRAMSRIKEKEEKNKLDRERALKSLTRSEVRLKLMLYKKK